MKKSIEGVKLIALYARVSTARQEEEETIKNQLDALREYAAKNSCSIVAEYTDDGWSGDILARPGLDRLRQDRKKGKWEAVLIYDPDRLARRYSYQELVMDELREAGIEVMFVTVSAPKNSEDKILHGVRGLFAEYERAKISERFRLGKLRKVKEGHVVTSEAPYGYTYIPKTDNKHGYYEVNPVEARAVKMIFSWVANEGVTLREIVRRLQEMSIMPRKSKRGVWSTSTLSTLLRNRTYVGEAQWGKSVAVVPKNPIKKTRYKKLKKTSRKTTPKEDWISIPVPALIEEKLFNKAQAQLESNYAQCKRNRKNKYLLVGRIRCACGRRRTGEGAMNGKHLYYRCTDRVLRFPLPPTCKEKGINARSTDKIVWERVSELMSSPQLLSEQAERWYSAEQKKVKTASVDVSILKREIAQLKKREKRYGTAYGAGVLTLEQLKEYMEPVCKKIAELEAQIATARRDAGSKRVCERPGKEEIEAFAEKAKVALKNLTFQAKRAIVLNTIEKIIGTKHHLQVFGYIPITQNVELHTNDRYRQGATRHFYKAEDLELVPFHIEIDLPATQYRR